MADQQFDPDLYTKLSNLTKSYYRSVYPAIEPKNGASDKIVLITGASRGIGKVLAISWAKAGASGIAICARKKDNLLPTVEDVKNANPNTEVLAVACDLTKNESVAELFGSIKEKFGRLNAVIANAGFANQMNQANPFPKIGEMEPDIWWDDVEVNVRTTYLTAYHYIRTFPPSISSPGTLVTMTSGAGSIIIPGMSSYGMAKQACVRIVEYLDAEYGSSGLSTFSLNPGIVKGIATMEGFVDFAYDEPELVGAMTVWLASGKAEALKGGYVNVNWDVVELEKHGEEIREKGLLKGKFLSGILGPEGYKWEM